MLELLTNKVSDSLEGSILQPGDHINVNDTERLLSVAAGTFLLFKGITSLFKHPIIGLGEAVAGTAMLYRGATGYCPVYNKIGKDTTDPEAVRISERFIVNRPREEVYRFWRKLENLPKFMKHLHSVSQIDDKFSYWKANIPTELVKLSWHAEITREEEGRYIGWQSTEGSMIDNAGKVEFTDAVSGAGTELNVEINYFPPAGAVGASIAKLLNRVFENMVRNDITNFKHFVEQEDYVLNTGL